MRRSRRGVQALVASSLIHVGLMAWAAQSVGLWQVRWSVAHGLNSTAAIEAQFSEGDLNHERVQERADDLALQIMKSTERQSPEDRLLTGNSAAGAISKQPSEPPPPRAVDHGALSPVTLPTAAHSSNTPEVSPAVDAQATLSAVPRAKPALSVQVEPIEPSVASASSSASQSSSGAANTPPSIVLNPAPLYPAEALTQRLTGRVTVRVQIDDRGQVTSAELHRSSGYSLLDDAAIEAVRRWRFEPPQGVYLRQFAVPVNFVLR